MNKNIFVTAFQTMPNVGSENYVGFYIVKTLISNGYNVHLYTPLLNQIEIRNYYKNNLPKNLFFPEVNASNMLKIFKPNPLKYSQYISNIFWEINIKKYLKYNDFEYDLYYHVNSSSWWAYNGMVNNASPVLLGPLQGYRFPRKGLWSYLKLKSFIFEFIRLCILKSPYALYNKSKIIKSTSDVLIEGEKNIFNIDKYTNVSHTLSGIDTHKNRVKPEIPKVILSGRFVDIKGYPIALKCLKEIDKDFIIEIYGRGPEEKNINKLIKEYNLEDKTIMKGFDETREQLISAMASANVFIAPYIRESASLMVSEALYAGLPVVTISDTGPSSVCSYFNSNLSKISEETGDALIENLKNNIEYYLDNFIIEDPRPASNFGENILKKIEETIN
ncbi:MAG: glycosyltransferase [Candidatus Actinomarinales bacterium]|nr:MAG: glycosyltransferase [Candidatus Actinomarinales bacterium]